MTVFITVGAPASGKSTWSREKAQVLGNTIISCRDDIRIAHGITTFGDPETEKFLTKVQRTQMEGAFLDGMNVIVADTNLNPKFRNGLVKFAHEFAQDVEIVVFHVPLDILIMRDRARATRVGDDVVQRFYNMMQQQNVQDQSLPAPVFKQHPEHDNEKQDIVVVDIDGTVAEKGDRSPYDESKVNLDTPIKDVIKIVRAIHDTYDIVFVSGRTNSCRDATAAWILKHMGIDVNNPARSGASLLMRMTGDSRPDYVIKSEIYDEYLFPYYNILMSFDDRNQVVRHIRRKGITVAHVAEGRF